MPVTRERARRSLLYLPGLNKIQRKLVFCLALVTLLPMYAFSQQFPITGRVLFSDGTPAGRARITITGGAKAERVEVVANAEGKFTSPALPRGSYRLVVFSEGLLLAAETVELTGVAPAPLTLTAVLSGPYQAVTVSATADARPAASMVSTAAVVSGERLRQAPEITADQSLRTVPGFSLFRRTSSLAANPTTQGVSLRGLGPSGASRSLVAVDGSAINDPFGGWVYWDLVPEEAIGEVDILRGAASSVYGNAALAGVIAISTVSAQNTAARVSVSGGQLGIAESSWLLAKRFESGRSGVQLAGNAFRDDGYYLLEQNARGDVDRPASLDYVSARARADHRFGAGNTLFASFGVLSEDRGNGTVFQENSTDLRYASVGAQLETASGNAFHLGAWAQGETFRSTFSSVIPSRSRETPTLAQRVPSNSVQLRGDWSRKLGKHRFLAGADFRWVQGDSIEQSLVGLRPLTIGGGQQRTAGGFAQIVLSPLNRLQFVASVRIDRWQTLERRTGTGPSATPVDPQLGIRYQLSGHVALRAQGYRGFRGPTLDELYRNSQVGNIVLRGNPLLVPERVNSAEAGADIAVGPSLARVTAFWTDLQSPVTNVTISPTLREKQNAGAARILGVEADWEWQPRRSLQLRASYLFDNAYVRRFSPDRTMEGLRLPQVPRHQGAIVASWLMRGGRFLMLDTRFSGRQFDNDRNTLVLAGYGETSASFTQPLGSHAEAFVRAQNVFDRRYPVAITPFVSLSAPRVVLCGVRLHLNR